MAAKKHLLLEELDSAVYAVIGINSTLEDYRLAFNLNKYLGIKLERSSLDVELFNDAKFQLFEYENEAQFETWHLVSNSYVSTQLTAEAGLLFESAELHSTQYLLPELKRAHYILKLTSDDSAHQMKQKINTIRLIWGINAAFFIEASKIKSKQNLIF